MDGNPVQSVFHALPVAFDKIDSRDRGGDLNSDRWHSQADDLPRLQEQLRRQVGKVEAEFLQGGDNAMGVGWVYRDPYVHVGGRTRITVVIDRVAADEQVLNCVSVEQSQELFEVVW